MDSGIHLISRCIGRTNKRQFRVLGLLKLILMSQNWLPRFLCYG